MMKKLIFIALLLGIGGYSFYFTLFQKKYPIIDVVHSEKVKTNPWVAFSPQQTAFSAFFPAHPKEMKKEISISGNDTYLEYNEYQCSTKEGGHYSISCITLPNSLLKWANNSVLNGAFKLLLKNLDQKVTLIDKQSNIFKTFPSLDYEHHTQDSRTGGMLVLVGKILYKVEVTYPCNDRTKMFDELHKFVEWFEPVEFIASS